MTRATWANCLLFRLRRGSAAKRMAQAVLGLEKAVRKSVP